MIDWAHMRAFARVVAFVRTCVPLNALACACVRVCVRLSALVCVRACTRVHVRVGVGARMPLCVLTFFRGCATMPYYRRLDKMKKKLLIIPYLT